MLSFLSRCFVIAAVALVLGGCQPSKINDDNYSKLKVGQTLTQVETILGESGTDETSSAGMSISGGGIGTQSASPEKIYTWKSKNFKIIVTVKDGKVVQLEKRAI